MIQFLEQLRQQKHPQKDPKPRKVKRPPLFKNINLEMQAFIVFLRYGSVKDPPRETKMTFKAVSDITKVHPSAINNVCRRWVANGYQIINKNKLRTNKHAKITPDIAAFMVNPKTLSDWAPYSLNQRAILIEQKFGVKVKKDAVAQVYKKHKVTYCQPQYAYCRKMEKEKEIAQQQLETVTEITELMKAGKQVIYIDESQFHKQLVLSRAWIKKDMVLRKPDGRGRGATVVGAISEKQGLVHYSILQESNNALTFSNFISELVRKIKGEAYVYMDNLSVHNAKAVKDHFNDRIQQRFLPPYSCALNPIERLWGLTKKRWKQLMVEQPQLIKSDEDLVNEVRKVMEEFRPQCSALASCHLEQMISCLRGKFV